MNKMFAVVFDMDGVIVDSNPFHKISLRQFAAGYGFELTEEEMRKRIFGTTNRQWILNLFGSISEEQIQKYAGEKESLFREMYKDHIKPVTGLIPFLELLEANLVPKAVATSAPPANVEFTLGLTGTRKYFPVILDDTFVTHGKPNPEIYLKAAAALGKEPAHCIVIEDSLSGIAAGKSAGCKVIGITTTHTPDELHAADFVIHDFLELNISVLERLVS